jgi:hypothetical protein
MLKDLLRHLKTVLMYFPVIIFFLPENSSDSHGNGAGLMSVSKYLPISGIRKGGILRCTEKENENL